MSVNSINLSIVTKVRFTVTNFKILLFKGRSVMAIALQVTRRERVKFSVKNNTSKS